MDLLFMIFATLFGGCIGSFLNVVIWRLPNRMSLVSPGSFCPKCKHPIRFYDNIPVFGWLFLRGKCRDCHEPISIRYPLVEFFCASIACFFAVLVFKFNFNGVYGLMTWEGLEPVREALAAFERGETFFAPSLETAMIKGFLFAIAWSIFFYMQLAVGLIEWDGHKTPHLLKLLIALFILILCARWLWGTGLDQLADPGDGPPKVMFLVFFIAYALVVSLMVGFAGWSDFLTVWLLALLSFALNLNYGPAPMIAAVFVILLFCWYTEKKAPVLALLGTNLIAIIFSL